MGINVIKEDGNNARKHTKRNLQTIRNSLDKLGAGRSILIDKDGIVIAGNATLSQAKELNIPVKVIKTDGKELIALQRTDLKPADSKRKSLAIVDNRATDMSEFDNSELVKLLSETEDDYDDCLGFNNNEMEQILKLLEEEEKVAVNAHTRAKKKYKQPNCVCPSCGHSFYQSLTKKVMDEED